MSLIVPPGFGIAAWTLSGQPGTEPYVTTCGVDLSGWGGDFVAAANRAQVCYQQTILTQTSNNLALDRVDLYVGADGSSGSVSSTGASVSGGDSGQHPPTAVSVLARKVTNDIGRRGRGRMFLPGVGSESDIDQDGSLVPGAQAALQPELDEFFDLLDGDGGATTPLSPVLLHATAPADPTPIVAFTLAPLVGIQRGRIR